MAQSYTRQSTFADGDTITASLFNNEYNQLINTFAYSSVDVGATGHRHDGTPAQGGNIHTIGDLDFFNKIVVDSTNNRWGVFVQVGAGAVEQIRIQDGGIVPVTTNDIDLGTASLQFKDIFIDGTANIDSLVLTSGSTVTTILDEDDLVSNSATALVTQQSVKAYIDAQVTAQDLDIVGDTGTDSIDLDSETITFTGGTGITSVVTTGVVTHNIDSTVATLTGTQTLTNKTITSPDINGGTIDEADITVGVGKTFDVSAGTLTLADNQISGDKVEGGTIAATTITDLTFGSLNDGAITVTAWVDEDNMVSNSATLVPTQQSVKAYVDSQVTAQDLDIVGDTGTDSIDLDSETITFTGGTGITSVVTTGTVTHNIDSTVTTLTGTQTLTNKTLTAPVISGNLTTDGNIDGRDVATDGAKLDGIEAGATADQTAAEIRALVEAATDSNVFTDADHTKLNGIEDNATADQTDAEIRAAVEAAIDSNVFTDADHTKLDGIEALADVTDTANVTAAGALMDSELTDITAVKALDQGVATTDSPTFVNMTMTGTGSVKVPAGTTGERDGSPVNGMFRYNSTNEQFEGYQNSEWGSIGGGGGSNTFTTDTFTGDGATTDYALSQVINSEDNLMVFIAGVFQQQSSYSIATASGITTLTFSVAPVNTREIVIYSIAGAVSGTNLNIDSMTGDGATDSLELSIVPVNENNTQVFIDGVYQSKANYSVSGTTLTFSTAPPTGTAVEVMTMNQTDINVPVDGTVTSAKLDTNIAIAGTLGVGGAATFSGEIAANGGIALGDNDKAIFGAGSDLQIYHDGSNSFISDVGTGNLGIRAENLFLQNADGSENYATATVNGAFTLSYDNSTKLATTATGIDVTGTVTADGLNVQNGSNAGITFDLTANYSPVIKGSQAVSDLYLAGVGGGGVNIFTTDKSRLLVQNNGDISFYEDTGTTPKFFWDASAESLGIGTSSPARLLDIKNSSNLDGGRLRLRSATAIDTYPTIGSVEFYSDDNSASSSGIVGSIDVEGIGAWNGSSNNAAMTFNLIQGLAGTTSPVEAMRIDASGNLLVNCASAPATTVPGVGIIRVSSIETELRLSSPYTGGDNLVLFYNPNGFAGSISTSGSATAYNTSSDYRLKEDAVPMTGATERVKALRPINFAWKVDGSRTDGFLAHEAQEVVPEAVHGTKDAMRDEEYEVTPAVEEVRDEDGNVTTEAVAAVMGTRSVPDYQGIDQSKLVPLLTAALQEAITKIEVLTARIEALEGV